MIELDASYQLALANQIGSLSTFLGGFSATFFVTMLTLAKPGTVARMSIGASALAAVAFIVAAGTSVTLTFTLHPAAPPTVADNPTDALRAMLAASFVTGMVALLAAIGIGGWIRSRVLGVFTSVVSVGGLVLIVLQM